MDERTRRTITWVMLGCLVAIVIGFAVARKTELDRMADLLANGTPAQQLAAVDRLVKKQKLGEALDERPRWVQDRAMLGIARLSTYDALWEAAGAAGALDGPPGGRLGVAIKQQGQTAMDLLAEAVQDKDGTRRGTCAGPLGGIGQPAIDPLTKLTSAWDQYVRDIVRDQLSAIATTMAGDQKAASDLLDLRKKWLAKYEAQAAASKSPADLEAVDTQRAKVAKAEKDLAALPPANLVPDLLMAAVKEKQPPQEEKDQVAKYLRRVATAKATIVACKVPVVPAVIAQLLPIDNPEVRASGCDLLGQMGNQTYALTGDVLGPPLAAAEAQKMVAPLLERLQKDPDWTVRRRACLALGHLQLAAMQEHATQPLIDALSNPQPDVRAAAAQALGMIAAARPFDEKALKWKETGPNETARMAAAPLAATLRNNRTGAAGELAVALEKVGPPAIPELIPALDHPDQEVRLLATSTVAHIGGDPAVAPLAHMLSDKDVLVRQTAADALRALATPAVAPELISALGDPDWKVYYAAKDALARIGSDAVPVLMAALSNPSARISYTAEQALAEIGGPAVSALVGGLASDNPQVLKWVSVALGDIGYEAVAPAAQTLAGSPKSSARAAAAQALGRTGQGDAVPYLIKAASDASPDVRIAVASALVKLGNPSATPPLVTLLQDPEQTVRAATMERMFEWYDPPAIPALAKLLTAPDKDTRRRAAILLADHVGGQEELRAAIASATTAGEAHNVSRAVMQTISNAVDTLCKRADPKSQSSLEALVKSTDPGPQYAAVAGVATVVDKTKADAVRDWAATVLGGELGAKETEVQQTAAVAVARSRVPGLLEEAVADATIPTDVRREAIAALGLLGTGTSVKVLVPLCEAGGPGALDAATAVGQIGRRLSEQSEGKDPQAVQAAKTLIGLATQQPAGELRSRLAVAVAAISEAAVPPAIDYLRQAPEDEKPFAAAILGKLGNVAVDPYLLRARSQLRFQTGQEKLRDWVSVALWATGDKMARDLVSSLPDTEKPPQPEVDATQKELDELLTVK